MLSRESNNFTMRVFRIVVRVWLIARVCTYLFSISRNTYIYPDWLRWLRCETCESFFGNFTTDDGVRLERKKWREGGYRVDVDAYLLRVALICIVYRVSRNQKFIVYVQRRLFSFICSHCTSRWLMRRKDDDNGDKIIIPSLSLSFISRYEIV